MAIIEVPLFRLTFSYRGEERGRVTFPEELTRAFLTALGLSWSPDSNTRTINFPNSEEGVNDGLELKVRVISFGQETRNA